MSLMIRSRKPWLTALTTSVALLISGLVAPQAAHADVSAPPTWGGDVTIAASAYELDYTDPVVAVTAETAEPVADGAFLAIVDSDLRVVAVCGDAGHPCTTTGTGGSRLVHQARVADSSTAEFSAIVLDEPIELAEVASAARFLASAEPISVSNAGWPGSSVEFVADTAVIPVGASTATVTATTAVPVAPPYTLAIVDTSGQWLAWCGAGGVSDSVPCAQDPGTGETALTAVVPVEFLGARTLTAYVSTATLGTGLVPAERVRAASTEVTISRPAWAGTSVALAASPTAIPLGSSTTVLSATTTVPVAAPYTLAIFDAAGTQIAWCGEGGSQADRVCSASDTGGSTLSVNVSVAYLGARTFTAVVSLTPASTVTVPPSPAAVSAAIEVTRPGWTGNRANLTVDRSVVSLSNTKAVITATADAPVSSPYTFVIVDVDAGNKVVAYCGRGNDSYTGNFYRSVACPTGADGGSELKLGISVPNASTRNFVAYISQVAPPIYGSNYTRPTNDLRAESAGVSVTNPGWTGQLIHMAADRPIVSLSNTNTVITATTDVPVLSPYTFVLVDLDAGNRIVAACGRTMYVNDTHSRACPVDPNGSGSQLTYRFAVPNAETHRFVGYVSLTTVQESSDRRIIGSYPAPPDPAWASSRLAVTNPGWTGQEVAVSADRPVVSLSNTRALITATTDVPVLSPYTFVLVDLDAGNRIVAACGRTMYVNDTHSRACPIDPNGSGSQLSYSFLAPNDTTHRFIAYVSTTTVQETGDRRVTGSYPAPPGPMWQSNGMAVTNPGWTGGWVAMSAKKQADGTATLTAVSDQPVTAPYTLAIYTDTGKLLSWCGEGGSLTDRSCSEAATGGSQLTANATAASVAADTSWSVYISRKAPSTAGIPTSTDDLRVSSGAAVSLNPALDAQLASTVRAMGGDPKFQAWFTLMNNVSGYGAWGAANRAHYVCELNAIGWERTTPGMILAAQKLDMSAEVVHDYAEYIAVTLSSIGALNLIRLAAPALQTEAVTLLLAAEDRAIPLIFGGDAYTSIQHGISALYGLVPFTSTFGNGLPMLINSGAVGAQIDLDYLSIAADTGC